MTLPNDPFDFLWRNDDGQEPGDAREGAADGSVVDGSVVNGSAGRSDGGRFRPVSSDPLSPDLDAFFDDDLSEAESELLYEHIRREGDLARDMLGTQRALEALRSTPSCPDFSQRILSQVDRKRGLLSGPWMKRLVIGRVAIAATLLLAMGGLFVMHRASPELATIGQPTPIGQLASALPADASRSQRRVDAQDSGSSDSASWMSQIDFRSAAMDSRAALHARSVMNAGPEARIVMVDAGETLPLGGDGVVFNSDGRVSGLLATASNQISVEFPSLQGVAIVHDVSHELAFQAILAQHAPPAEDAGSAAPRVERPSAAARSQSARASQPIITDDCVYYMGRVVDRHAFQTVLAGFTAMTPTPLD